MYGSYRLDSESLEAGGQWPTRVLYFGQWVVAYHEPFTGQAPSLSVPNRVTRVVSISSRLMTLSL